MKNSIQNDKKLNDATKFNFPKDKKMQILKIKTKRKALLKKIIQNMKINYDKTSGKWNNAIC